MFNQNRRPSTPARRNNARRPAVECLENRVVLSWTAVPPATVNLAAAADDHFNISSFGTAGGFATTSKIASKEVDFHKFTALRTGSYTFEAQASGSGIDTVEAL